MIPVSDAWKEAHKRTLLPETFVEISYIISEPGLQNKATVSGNYPEPYSDTTRMMGIEDKTGEVYATLDYGAWGLDGGFSYFDGSSINPGYVDSNYSTVDCSIDVTPYPTITISLPELQNVLIPGVTIHWSKSFCGWATDFVITAYDSNKIVAQTTVTNNTEILTKVWFDLINYSKVTIEILKWSHPFQRIRCSELLLGIGMVYTKSDLLGFDHKQSVDLLSAVLPQSEVTFRLRNDDDRWNPKNPKGTEKYLLEQQEIKVRYGMDIDGVTEWIKGGTFWISEWETPSNGMEANFTARDALSFMNGRYIGTRSGRLYDIAVAAFTEAKLPVMSDGGVRYVIDDSLKNISTDFSADTENYSIAEILQMIAHAGCCVFYQDRDGVVHIEPNPGNYSDYVIEPRVSYSHPEYTTNKPLQSIMVSYYQNNVHVGGVGSFFIAQGQEQTVENPMITTRNDAQAVCDNAINVLKHRQVISGEFRADLRLDALDNIAIDSKYASDTVCITDITYSTTGGAFKGKYTGRVISDTVELLIGGDEV